TAGTRSRKTEPKAVPDGGTTQRPTAGQRCRTRVAEIPLGLAGIPLFRLPTSPRRKATVIARFFVDRPIFATVISVVFVLAGAVALALPVIPPLVQNEGINVRKMSPNTLMIVNLISPDDGYDATFLSNYATIYVRDELGRVPGVAGITYLGQRDYSLRAWLDPDKLAALKMGAMDVVDAIAQQNVQVAAGQIGQPPVPSRAQQFQLTINTQGRPTEPEQF